MEQKICMITGGLGGFASAISGLILKRGAKVWLCDLKQEDEGMLTLQNQFPEAFDKNNIGYCQCDVTNENSFDAAFRKCIEKLGEVPDILINAAGILGEEQWDTLYDINLVSKYLYVITHHYHFILFYIYIYNALLQHGFQLLEGNTSRYRTSI